MKILIRKVLNIAFIGMLFLSACGNSNEHISNSFITGYTMADDVEISWTKDNEMEFKFTGETVKSKELFEQLSIENGDISCTKVFSPSVYGPRCALAYPIQSMKVYTLDYFNREFPSGSDISSIVKCSFLSYWDFVKNGYECQNDEEWPSTYTYPIDQICGDNTRLSKPFFWTLIFDESPSKSGDYKFVLSVEMDGKTIEKDFEMSF